MSTNPSKKRGRVVPSRYRQAAEKVSIAASIREKSTFVSHSRSRSLPPRSAALRRDENSRPKITVSTPTSEGQSTMPPIDESVISNIGFSQPTSHCERNSSLVVPPRYKQASEKVHIEASIRDKFVSHSRSRSLSPKSPALRRNENSIPKITVSTPTSEGQSTMPFIDESAIPNTAFSQLSSHCERNSDGIGESVKRSLFQRSSFVNSHERILIQRHKEFEDDISILFCEYLQAKFIESSTIESVQTRCKDSLEKIYKVWYYIQALLGKNAKVNKDLNVISYFVQAHEHLKKQEKIIQPMIGIIPLLQQQYEKISTAVHKAKHSLEVKDLLVSNGDCEKVMILLKEITLFLNSINIAVGDCDKIIQSSDVKHKFVNQGRFILDELKRASDMLSEASNDLVTEMSLHLS